MEKLDLDWCLEQVSTKIFKLRPEGYHKEHPSWPGMVGIELELFPLIQVSEPQPSIMPLYGQGSSTEALSRLLTNNRLWKADRNDDGSIRRIDLGQGDQITFEPGGQIEYSSKPFACLDDACKALVTAQKTLSEGLKGENITLLQAGSHPWQSAEDIGLQMSKPRYQAMDRYFQSIESSGRRMMRETCTIQVNLDFGGQEHTLAKRYLAANLLAPIMTAVFAHSPISLGQPNGYRSVRAHIWQNLDPNRTGFPDLEKVSQQMSLQACAQVYLDHVIEANVVFVSDLNFKVPDRPITFREWMRDGIDGVYPKASDFETHLSLHFPEVRARGFMELRSLDCQAEAWQIVPACVWTGLLYDDQSLTKVLDLLTPHLSEVRNLWKMSPNGLQSTVLHDLSRKIMYLAEEGFTRLPSCYQGKGKVNLIRSYIELFTSRGRCPADDLIDEAQKTNNLMTYESMARVHRRWLTKIA